MRYLALGLLAGCFTLCGHGRAAETVAGALPDDAWTRGDWPGMYGAFAYVLFGARSPDSLYGGPGYGAIRVRGKTGDPDDHHRAWLSLMNTIRDDRALLVPKLGRRIAAVWDDHGEVKPFAEKTGLFLDVDLPKARFLLSLYFFEIDWIQYRDYQILVVDRQTNRPILETHIDNFSEGKYKRMVFDGPLELRVKILAGRSPNAVCSGLFLDVLAPVMRAPDWITSRADGPAAEGGVMDALDAAAALAEEALGRFDENAAGADDYLITEGRYLSSFVSLEQQSPSLFFRHLTGAGTQARARLARFVRIALDDRSLKRAHELEYWWARALLDVPARREAREGMAGRGETAAEELGGPRRSAESEKLRNEAASLLQDSGAEGAAERVRQIVRELLKRGDLRGVATILDRLNEVQPDRLNAEDHFLWGSSLLFGEDYAEAEKRFQAAIEGGLDERLRPWAYANATACLIELKRLDEAQQFLGKFEKAHPGSREHCLSAFQLGQAFAAAKRPDKARETLRLVTSRKGCGLLVRKEAERILRAMEPSGTGN